MVSGESMPVAKGPDDKLIGGTVNSTGSLVMIADKIGADTMLSRIVHMVAAAVVTAANARNITVESPAEFASVTGKGVTGKVGGRAVALGSAKLMADQGIDLDNLAGKADELRRGGATALFIGVDGKPGGCC
ncbi:hypothetical protein MCP1_180064 [Candidatus Terasakiella magnetica]|nr:hypothetical protein MCP1_180064 [Candidatus Terasakiella magnetica]